MDNFFRITFDLGTLTGVPATFLLCFYFSRLTKVKLDDNDRKKLPIGGFEILRKFRSMSIFVIDTINKQPGTFYYIIC